MPIREEDLIEFPQFLILTICSKLTNRKLDSCFPPTIIYLLLLTLKKLMFAYEIWFISDTTSATLLVEFIAAKIQ